jgi:hypothetical protein
MLDLKFQDLKVRLLMLLHFMTWNEWLSAIFMREPFGGIKVLDFGFISIRGYNWVRRTATKFSQQIVVLTPISCYFHLHDLLGSEMKYGLPIKRSFNALYVKESLTHTRGRMRVLVTVQPCLNDSARWTGRCFFFHVNPRKLHITLVSVPTCSDKSDTN